MTTTIPTANSLLFTAVSLLITAGLLVFAAYDARKKRVPNKGLAFFLPVVLAALPVRYLFEQQSSLLAYIGECAAGAAVGGGILLAAAMASNGGIGGGDIKLAAVIGLFYGPYEMLMILLAGTLPAFLYSLIKRRTGSKNLHIAYVPFLAFGSLLLTLLNLKGVLFP